MVDAKLTKRMIFSGPIDLFPPLSKCFVGYGLSFLSRNLTPCIAPLSLALMRQCVLPPIRGAHDANHEAFGLTVP